MPKLTRGRCQLKQLLARASAHSDIKITQSWLAHRTGYSRQQIWNWANDRDKMPYEAAVLIALILNCHAEDLYQWEIE